MVLLCTRYRVHLSTRYNYRYRAPFAAEKRAEQTEQPPAGKMKGNLDGKLDQLPRFANLLNKDFYLSKNQFFQIYNLFGI